MVRAFSLIELLIVTAIMGILATILFPVFKQGKQKSDASIALNHCRQISVANTLYVADYNDRTMTLEQGRNQSDWTNKLFPYTRNEDVFLNPARTDLDTGCLEEVKRGKPAPGEGSDEPGCRYVGFGYNWGPILRRGGGLLSSPVMQFNHDLSPSRLQIGVRMSEIENPGRMFAFAISYDSPRVSMTPQFLLDSFTGKRNRDLFFGGMWPVGYVDGSAQTMKWVGGYGDPAAEAGQWAIPANSRRLTDFCVTPDVRLGSVPPPGEVSEPDGEADVFPMGIKCSDLAKVYGTFGHGPYVANSKVRAFYPN